MRPRIRQLLFDFDEVLAKYHHEARIAFLGRHAGCAPERVREVLFASGLEREYDGGRIDTATYLARLGDGVGKVIDEATWIASRLAGSRADPALLAHVAALDASLPLAVLSNNGALMARAIPRVLGTAADRFEGRVLCSGGFGLRKPDPAIFTAALVRLGWDAGSTLFVDDSFRNVQGARHAGMHAETVTDLRSLRRVLRRFQLA